jgi:hypothetical protein
MHSDSFSGVCSLGRPCPKEGEHSEKYYMSQIQFGWPANAHRAGRAGGREFALPGLEPKKMRGVFYCGMRRAVDIILLNEVSTTRPLFIGS